MVCKSVRRYRLLRIVSLATLGSASAVGLWGQFSEGVSSVGENGEVVIESGVVVREVVRDGFERPLLAVGSAKGDHFLYDPNQLTMTGFWTGRFGSVGDEGRFQPDDTELKTFYLDRFPWSFGEKPRVELEADWKGYAVRDGQVWMRYRLREPDGSLVWDIEETLNVISSSRQRIRFSIEPSSETDRYLNYWLHQRYFRRLSTSGQQNQRNRLKNLHPNQTEFEISFYRRKEGPTLPHGYSVVSIEIPSDTPPFRFEPTDIDFAPNGDVFVSTRTGKVWRRAGSYWSVFADGLHEINGLRVDESGRGVYVMQKPELTHLMDTDGDGVADLYRTIEDRFRFTGNYHQFAFGPRVDGQGNLYFSTGLTSGGGDHIVAPEGYPNQMTSPLGYRGWVMKRTPEGDLIPYAAGLRSPAGIGMNAQDELFITDNQGDWVASSYLGHVEEGDFLGHPAALWDEPELGLTPRVLDYRTVEARPDSVPPLDREAFRKRRKPPAVWLAHVDLTNSPGHPSFAPASGFGPFAGQAFIADIAHRNVVRVALEKVDGEYQGAVFPFLRPLQSSSYSSAFDAEGNLWVGSVGRGWTAGDPAIEIIRYDPSKTPFEMRRIELTAEGFDIHFTEPIVQKRIDSSVISIIEYGYEYWDGYGSEPIDERSLPIEGVEIVADGKTLSLKLSLKAGAIYQIDLPELKSASGLSLENNYAVYTLNRLLP